MFYGEYRHAIDEKGRVIIPARFREALIKLNKNKFILTRGLEKSLFIFSLDEWKSQEEKFKSLSLNKSNPRAFSRIVFSGAYRSSLDKQGRLNLPRSLIEYARIEKEVVIIGVSDRIEIWDSFRWRNYRNKSERSFIEIAKELAGGRKLKVVESK